MKNTLLVFCILCLICFQANACDETVVIDSVEHAIDDVWCGQKIDTTFIAKYEDLSRLPDSLSYKDYKIYIRHDAHKAFVAMADAALKDSISFSVKSGFRSPGYQRQMVRKRLDEGKSFADVIKFVAPPGYSEHSTGNAVDVASDTYPFSKSKAYQWLLKNANKFGFIERYPKGNHILNTWEPWHWTFVAESDTTIVSMK